MSNYFVLLTVLCLLISNRIIPAATDELRELIEERRKYDFQQQLEKYLKENSGQVRRLVWSSDGESMPKWSSTVKTIAEIEGAGEVSVFPSDFIVTEEGIVAYGLVGTWDENRVTEARSSFDLMVDVWNCRRGNPPERNCEECGKTLSSITVDQKVGERNSDTIKVTILQCDESDHRGSDSKPNFIKRWGELRIGDDKHTYYISDKGIKIGDYGSSGPKSEVSAQKLARVEVALAQLGVDKREVLDLEWQRILEERKKVK